MFFLAYGTTIYLSGVPFPLERNKKKRKFLRHFAASAACFSLGACLNKSRYTSKEEGSGKSACLETRERETKRGADKKRRQDVTGTLIERFAHTCSMESREFLPLSNNVPGLRIPGAMGTITRFITKFPCNLVHDVRKFDIARN